MTIGSMLLTLAAVYLGSRWLGARAENERLVAEVAMLRRRLAARRAA